ncbi:MAG: single-stranded DNA-binding protein [Bacteroidales bacterium]|jgi:single-strand DNA-binding protein|nr:single-stranded DNA-binding protein [Bacteroidales bacterium]MBR3288086.1 single-stranded DNA-binding protein [Bacteroidales bacterium]MCR5714877.1 single-stranded DNA-binding protein [Bacteroidales bacterium]
MVNKVILIGRVGRDPDIRAFDAGAKKASFTLATSETFKNRDGVRSEQTEWHNIVLWRNAADIAERFVRKGSMLYLEGRIRYRSWDDASGNKRYTTDIECDVIRLLDKKGDGPQPGGVQPPVGGYNQPQPAAATPQNTAPISLPEEPDDLPF